LALRNFESFARERKKPSFGTKNMDKKNSKEWSAIGLAWELGYTIAVPLVALALVGRYLDKKLGTSPWILLVGILVSIALSSWLVYKKTLDIIGK